MQTYLGIVSTILSVSFIIGCHLCVFILANIVRKHKINGTLESKVFKDRFGTIIDDIKLTGFFGTYWNLIVLVRWSITCFIMVFLRNTPAA